MTNTSQPVHLRQYFNSGATRGYAFRKEQLKKLRRSLLQHETALYEALYTDLRKSREEVWVTEIGFLLAEINLALKNLKSWMAPERTRTNLANLPSGSRIMKEPLGVVLIIGPWNYPVQLLFNPLVGAIAAGNCVVLKPSEHNPATSEVMRRIVESVFPPEYIWYVQGDGAEVVPALMRSFRFDHVFFTGSTVVGREIYLLAADQLVPVTLELGGKSPCVVEADADLVVAARRIAVAKFSNAGQMCVAPDYILVHNQVKDAFIKSLQQVLLAFYGEDPSVSYSYGRMINTRQFDRVVNYLQQGKLVHGGQHRREDLYIAPALLTDISPGASVMQEEIFGPVLPILSYDTPESALKIIEQHPNPLAFYVFTRSAVKENEWLSRVAFGGGCVNNTAWHLTNHHLPFGGRGASGLGRYHGKYSFDTFTHEKPVMKTPTWPDPSIKYPPFKGRLGLFKKLIR